MVKKYILAIIAHSAFYVQGAVQKPLKAESNARDPITILVHGTRLIPLKPDGSSFVHRMLSRHLGTPEGLKHVSELSAHHAFVELAQAVCDAHPDLFSLDKFYFYGWSGNLSPLSRLQAGKALYYVVMGLRHNPEFKDCPITAIGHSHGGNVILYSASHARNKGDENYFIDRLVLLGCPIQDFTEQYAYLPAFKAIYNLYSGGDLIQVIDPQKLYAPRERHLSSFFSWRELAPASNIKQAKIRWRNRALGHLDFMRKDFFSELPSIIALLDDQYLKDAKQAHKSTYSITLKKKRKSS